MSMYFLSAACMHGVEEKELLAWMRARARVVAKNEYRIYTSRIRKIRPYFLYLVIGLLAVYVAFIAPAVVSPLIDDFVVFIVSVAAVPLVQIILFMFFFYLILFPISARVLIVWYAYKWPKQED